MIWGDVVFFNFINDLFCLISYLLNQKSERQMRIISSRSVPVAARATVPASNPLERMDELVKGKMVTKDDYLDSLNKLCI